MGTNSTPCDGGFKPEITAEQVEQFLYNPVDDGRGGSGPRLDLSTGGGAPKLTGEAVSKPVGDDVPRVEIDTSGAPPQGADDTIALYDGSQGFEGKSSAADVWFGYFEAQEQAKAIEYALVKDGATSGDLWGKVKQFFQDQFTPPSAPASEEKPGPCYEPPVKEIQIKDANTGEILTVPQAPRCGQHKPGSPITQGYNTGDGGGGNSEFMNFLDLFKSFGQGTLNVEDVKLGGFEELSGARNADAFAALGFSWPEERAQELNAQEAIGGGGGGSGFVANEKGEASSSGKAFDAGLLAKLMGQLGLDTSTLDKLTTGGNGFAHDLFQENGAFAGWLANQSGQFQFSGVPTSFDQTAEGTSDIIHTDAYVGLLQLQPQYVYAGEIIV